MFASNTSQVSSDATYVEDVFSTWLYTGNGSTQTITNGIDLSGKGGVVWVKSRSNAYDNWIAADASSTKLLITNATDAAYSNTGGFANWQYTSSGFNLLSTAGSSINGSGSTFSSWTFRKQPKFFDVVTYTGNGATTRSIAHALGSTPGCIIVKRTDASGYNWYVYHRSLGTNGSYPNYMYLNTTDGEGGGFYAFFSAAPTSTDFSVGYYSGSGGAASLNVNGATYVAYLFAHNAGGFGLTGTDNVISCGSFTTDGSGNATVNLGYEPQWILRKRVDAADDWYLLDNMRGMVVDNGAGTGDKYLYPNASYAEFGAYGVDPTSTGFKTTGIGTSSTHIYIAIRRGPMKTPTSGTSVFAPVAQNLIASASTVTTNFPVDLNISAARGRTPSALTWVFDRLRGKLPALATTSTAAESSGTGGIAFDSNTSVIDTYWGTEQGASGQAGIYWNFRRAPGFFDEVCYTGTGSATTQTHNLGVAPELIIIKKRSTTGTWPVYTQSVGATQYLTLNSTNSVSSGVNTVYWNDTSPTASVFSVGTSAEVNASGSTYVAYLFASCPGVSKVGSYAGTASTQTISCGFAVRFVLIKRTDSAGSWWVWDTARGMVAGTDPRLPLNTTTAENNANWVYTDASGFQIVTTDATVNASGGSYIYLAIA